MKINSLLPSITVSENEKSKSPVSEKQEVKWLEVIPHGLVGGMIPNLCLMVFKEKKGSKRFAVSLSHLQGQISLHQSIHREEPFRFVSDLFQAMKLKIEKCYFLQNKGSFINVQVVISGHPHVHSLQLKANDVIPFAIYSGCRFFCTKKFFNEMLDQKMEKPLKKQSFRKPLFIN